jgi:hypothetical protein
MTFQDIEIVGIDEEASSRSQGPHSGLFNIALKLSSFAPSEWSDYFNQRWQQHLYMMKRRARASGSAVTIHCPPDQLEKEHMPELKIVIDETNKAYRGYLIRAQASEKQRRKAEASDKAILQDLAKRISN